MKAVCWEGRNDVRVEDVPDPTLINPRDAIVRVLADRDAGQTFITPDAVVGMDD